MQKNISKITGESPCSQEIKKEKENFSDDETFYAERKTINIGAEYLFSDCTSQTFSLPTLMPSSIEASLPSMKSIAKEQKIACRLYYKERLKDQHQKLRLLNDRIREQRKQRLERKTKHFEEIQNLLKRMRNN